MWTAQIQGFPHPPYQHARAWKGHPQASKVYNAHVGLWKGASVDRRTLERMEGLLARTWAKTGDGTQWMCISRHLSDAGSMAGTAWDRFMSWNIRESMARMADPEGRIGIRRTIKALRDLAVFMASIHDVGKANPVFQYMIADGDHGFLCERLTEYGMTPPPEGYSNAELRHEAVSGLAIIDWALAAGFDRRHAMALQAMVSGHHGFFDEYAKALKCMLMRNNDSKWNVWLDGSRAPSARPWTAIRRLIIGRAVSPYEESGSVAIWKRMSLPTPVQSIIAAVVVTADWMASNEEAFPAGDDGVRVCDANARRRRALGMLDLGSAWDPQPGAPPFDDAWFAAQFPSIGAGARMNPMQETMVKASASVASSPLIICESEMGSGKTEAALASARILASRFGCGGVSFALPTMATTDAMFSRIMPWAERMGAGGSVALSHGDAWLNSEWRRVRSSDSWTGRGRMSVLSSFHVSTIDRLLHVALKGRHVELDHLGFASKVVIIDEMHSADEYMLAYVERTLNWLASWHAPVIILSATLPESTRRRLVKAYSGADDDLDFHDHGYPLITIAQPDGEVGHLTCDQGEHARSKVAVVAEPAAGLVDDALGETRYGGCSAVIMDTVSSAQTVFSQVRSAMGDDGKVMLLHSRFCADDRHSRERRLIRMLGPHGRRPDRLVVVSTQVIEQSLDLDFDFMHTAVAPIDILLQRSGRLHRREDTPRPKGVGNPVLRVVGAASGPEPPRRSVNDLVYAHYHLLAAQAEIAQTPEWVIPDSIPLLIHGAYDVIPEMRGWEKALKDARSELDARLADKRRKAGQSLLAEPSASGSLTGMTSRQLDSVPHGVRDGIWPLRTVLLVDNGDGTVSPWTRRGVRIRTDMAPSWKVMPSLMGSSLPLPMGLSSEKRIEQSISDLTRAATAGPLQAWDEDGSPMQGEYAVIVDNSGALPEIGGMSLLYDNDAGLTRVKEEGK